MKYTGSCHCGETQYEVEGELTEVLECNCSMCRRKGTLLWFVPRSSMTLQTPIESLSVYTFNKETIRHHFCPTCGVTPFALGQMPDGSPMAAINARCLDDIEIDRLKRNFHNGKDL